MPRSGCLHSLHAAATVRRARRLRRRRLEADLAAFSTPAERTELCALLAGSPDEDVEEIQEILHRQAMARLLTPVHLFGSRSG